MLNLYYVYDKGNPDHHVLVSFTASNDAMAIRENAPSLSRVVPLGDCELRQYGTIDEVSAHVDVLDEPRVVDWNSYHFPENPLKKTPDGSIPSAIVNSQN